MRGWLLIALVGCEHGQTPGSDGSMPPFDGVTLPCSRETLIEGELVDWDSTDASFLGVAGATIEQVGDPTVVTTTPPNGRLQICANPALPFEFSINGSGDYLDGTLSVSPQISSLSIVPLSLRTLTASRVASFLNIDLGVIFDPSAAQVVVFSAGDRATLSLDEPHEITFAGEDSGDGVITWTPGATGRYVLFTNVTPSASGGQLTGDPTGARTIPLVGGRISLVALAFVLE